MPASPTSTSRPSKSLLSMSVIRERPAQRPHPTRPPAPRTAWLFSRCSQGCSYLWPSADSWQAGVGNWDRPSPSCTLRPSSLTDLSVSQPPGKTLTGHSVGPSSALPGDPYNSVDFSEISPSASSDSGEGTSVRVPSGFPTASPNHGVFSLRTALFPDHVP